MATDRKQIAYRPDDVEDSLLAQLAKKRGLPKSRTIGQLVREAAEREGIKPEQNTEDLQPK